MSSAEERAAIMEERGKIYGTIDESFGAVAKCWTGMLRMHYGIIDLPDLHPQMVALMMVQLKCVRATRVYHDDNYKDAHNYIEIADELFKGAAKPSPLQRDNPITVDTPKHEREMAWLDLSDWRCGRTDANIGDKVVCVDAEGCEDDQLVVGKHYNIQFIDDAVDTGQTYLMPSLFYIVCDSMGDQALPFSASRFQKVAD